MLVCVLLMYVRVEKEKGEEEEDNTENACDTLLMCIVTVLNHGLRNGGGVGDVLRRPSKEVCIQTEPSCCFRAYK